MPASVCRCVRRRRRNRPPSRRRCPIAPRLTARRQPQADSRPKRRSRRAGASRWLPSIRPRKRASPARRSTRSRKSRNRPATSSAACPACRRRAASRSMGSLPRVASKLAAGQPVVIIAFGSSSTAGYGATSPEFNYPNRLAAQLRRQYPTADITVINRGKGGEDAPEMMKRLQTAVHRHASGSGDLAGRHQCGAAQPRSGRDRQARRGRHHAHSGGGRRRRAGRSAIFAARSTSTPKAPAR